MDHVRSESAHDVTLPAMITDHLSVIKPMIVGGNLMTAAAGFALGSGGRIDYNALWITVLGISLVVAAACVCNNCLDRDMDRKMVRTRDRALAAGRMSTAGAMRFAGLLALGGLILLASAANLLAVFIVLAGLGIYLGVYTLYLKRRSVHATVIGSLAGAAPALAGYCAAADRFDTGAILLLIIFCLWQIPHSYAIAVCRRGDYHAAAIPVLPLKNGLRAARRHITSFTAAFAAAVPFLSLSGYTGRWFLIVTLTAGLFWLWLCRPGRPTDNVQSWAARLFYCSIVNLVVLSAMMALDSVRVLG